MTPPVPFPAWLRQRTRHIWNRPHLSVAALLFLGILLTSSPERHSAYSLLLAFDAAATFFLLVTVRMMNQATTAAMSRRARAQREGRWPVLIAGLAVSLATIGALAMELHGKDGSWLRIALAASTIVLAWCFFNTLFALHYAHAYYDSADNEAIPAGLEFPHTETPDYWDFMYFAFVLGMTFQVSDVQIASRSLRRLALLHGLIAFFFNVVIIALTVNVIAGLG